MFTENTELTARPGRLTADPAGWLSAFYARQSWLIDTGDAVAWADTFTADGVFDSPSYPSPVRGRDELVAFAQSCATADRQAGRVSRHVVTTVDVVAGDCATTLSARAYLQIVVTERGAGSRLLRMTTVRDEFERADDGGWRVRGRRVSRDDQTE